MDLHLLKVPFENLDIHYGHPINLQTPALYQKIVERGRGGACHELNGLFAILLETLGFSVIRLSARVYGAITDTYGPEFDHLALLIGAEGREYLVDVGFGAFIQQPLALELGLLQEDPTGTYVIEALEQERFGVFYYNNDKKEAQYSFDLTPRTLVDFEGMCHYHQTSPNSHFTQKRLISKRLPTGGRVSLVDEQLKITQKNGTKEVTDLDEAAFEAALKQYFQLELSDLLAKR